MEYSKGTINRIFTVRIDQNEDLLEQLELLAVKENIRSAFFILLGAASRAHLVVGPKENRVPPYPMWYNYYDPHEMLGVGNIFFENDVPKIHLHVGAGRGEDARVGCLRQHSKAFMVLEVFIMEIDGINAKRILDPERGFAPIQFNTG